MFHVLTETVAEEMTPTSRALTLFDVAALEVCQQRCGLSTLMRCGQSNWLCRQ